MSEVLTSDYIRAELYGITGYDNTAARKAIEFVNDEPRKFELFKDAYKTCQTEAQFVARAQKAARDAQQALDLFTQQLITQLIYEWAG